MRHERQFSSLVLRPHFSELVVSGTVALRKICLLVTLSPGIAKDKETVFETIGLHLNEP